ncbi:hypothetical protein QUF76_13035 [Desulfobacterales bacterium HSG16]|nr:hypothetical protein [Desulfobacterales bacterium HSG16]
MHFEDNGLAIKQFVAHILPNMSHKNFCGYFVSHNQQQHFKVLEKLLSKLGNQKLPQQGQILCLP